MAGATQSSSDVDVSDVDSTPLDVDDLFDVQSELNSVSAQWRSIGTALRLKPDILDSIQATNSGDPRHCLGSVVTEWLIKKNYNVKKFGEPTWQWLVKAVGDPAGGGDMALARNMTRRHKAGAGSTSSTIFDHPNTSPPTSPSPHCSPLAHSVAFTPEPSKAAVFARENRQAIMAKFADFQTNVCDKLFKNGVNTKHVRLYVINQFPPGGCIPPPPASLTEMFEAITHNGLWDYFHYSPLARIAKKFGADDPEIEGWVKTYKKDLKAYSMVAKVEEYIEDDIVTTDLPPAHRAKYDPNYYCPMEWKTEFIDHSLQYLAEVWEAFSSHYLVPDSPPTALLDRVQKGCLSVTWLVPSNLISTLIEQVKVNSNFFQQHRILRVTVGEKCIYERESIANYVPRKECGLHRHSGNIAAIDFGTTNCSIAYTTVGSGSEVPCILTLNQTYYRVPTTILFKPDGFIDSFGYDARSEYLNLDDEDRLECAYFEQIKMNLQHDENVNREMKIEARNGKKYYLVDVVAQILNHLKIELIENNLQRGGHSLEATDFDWVITVPAIWGTRGKQIMREAGYKAGLRSQETCGKLQEASASPLLLPNVEHPGKLSLALESECAAIYCQNMSEQFVAPYCTAEKPYQSTCYLVVNIGGGTVDISAHKVSPTQDQHIQIMHLPAGNDCGGSRINNEFKTFLEGLVSDKEFSRYLRTNDPVRNAKHSADLNDLVNWTFEERKVVIGRKGGVSSALAVRMPYTFLEVYKGDIDNSIRQMEDAQLKRVGQDLRIEYSTVANFFQPVVEGILECISQTLRDVEEKLDTIYLVGGFGGSHYIYKRISEQFGSNYKYITPAQPDLAVIRGAILYRQNPDFVHPKNLLDLI